MKKTTTLLMTSLSLLALGCDKGGGATNPETDATTGASISVKDGDEGKAGDGKTLIVYFSRAGENWQVGTVSKGNTAVMVDYMLEVTGADVFEIVPKTAYPQDYDETLTVATDV